MHPLDTASRLGIDIGRVIIGAADPDGQADTSFISGGDDEAALATPPVPGAFETIRRLAERVNGRVWLVSKCGPRIQALTLRWLAHHRFHEITGVAAENVRFCRERREKRDHALDLVLTHFIDDRADVLDHLEGVVPSRILFGHQKSPTAVGTAALDWAAVHRLLLPPAAPDECPFCALASGADDTLVALAAPSVLVLPALKQRARNRGHMLVRRPEARGRRIPGAGSDGG